MTKHFQCTACGQCCYGQLPLSSRDALANVSRFPLAMVWTAVQAGSKDFKHVSHLGPTIVLPGRRELAILIVPTSFIPGTYPCPALVEDKLCGIHDKKPLRCRTMPFYPYREERYQGELLVPRHSWACNTSEEAPIVYKDNRVVTRADFDQERKQLLAEKGLFKQYADYMFKYSPALINSLLIASTKQGTNHVVTSLSSFLTATKNPDAPIIAQAQLPILRYYAEKTAGDSQLLDFHKRYVNWSKEMEYLSQPKATTQRSHTNLQSFNKHPDP